MFLPPGRSTPVLPPIAASTWASRVVGIWTNSTPRRKQPAANPARSPTLPPPKARTRLSRLPPAASISFQSRSADSIVFAPSPSSTSRITHFDAARRSTSSRSPCSACTRGVVTRNAVRRASQSSSSGSTDEIAPSPTMTGVVPSG